MRCGIIQGAPSTSAYTRPFSPLAHITNLVSATTPSTGRARHDVPGYKVANHCTHLLSITLQGVPHFQTSRYRTPDPLTGAASRARAGGCCSSSASQAQMSAKHPRQSISILSCDERKWMCKRARSPLTQSDSSDPTPNSLPSSPSSPASSHSATSGAPGAAPRSG